MPPHTSYTVCATQRSGSNLLCEALVNTGAAGRPTEYFLPAGVVPLVAVYEDFIQSYEETIVRVLEFLDIRPPLDLPPGPVGLEQQADELSDEWVGRYRVAKEAGSRAVQWEYVAGKGLIGGERG